MRIRYFILILILLGGISAAANPPDPATKRLLMIHSHHAGHAWTDTVDAQLRKKLHKDHNLILHTEFMDMDSHKLEAALPPFYAYLSQKYAIHPPQLIIATGNPALQFLEQYQHEFLPETPIIFCGSYSEPALITRSFQRPITGVMEKPDFSGTIHLIRTLQPQNRRLIIISSDSPSMELLHPALQKSLNELQTELVPLWWHNLSFEEIQTNLQTLSPNDAILLLPHSQIHPESKQQHSGKGINQLANQSPCPIYSLWDIYLGQGIVGGRLIRVADQGVLAGELALSTLYAHHMPAIITPHTYLTTFDYTALRAHDLNPDVLPEYTHFLSAPKPRRWLPRILFLFFSALVILVLASLTILLRPWLHNRKTALTVVFRQSLLGMVGIMALCIMLLLIFNAYTTYHQEIEEMRHTSLEQRREAMCTKITDTINVISYLRSHEHERIKEELKKRTAVAVELADHLFRLHADKPIESVRASIRESLSGIRWADEYGYYFATDRKGIMQVHPIKPEMVGQNCLDLTDPEGVELIREMAQLVQYKDEGFAHYRWQKSSNTDAPHTFKTSHVRLFKPLDWIIGTGFYEDDLLALTQKLILNQLASIRMEHDADSIFILTHDGTPLLSPPHLPDGTPIAELLVSKAAGAPEYYVEHLDHQTPIAITYMKSCDEWGWWVGITHSTADILAAVQQQKEQLKSLLLQQSLIILSTGIFAFAAMLYLSRGLSARIERELRLLLNGTNDRSACQTLLAPANYKLDELAQIADSTQKAFQALIASELNLQTFFDASPDFVFVLDLNTHILHTNNTIPNRLGFSQKELTGAPFLHCFAPEHQRAADRQLRGLIARKLEQSLIPLQTKSGEEIVVETTLQHAAWNAAPALFIVCRDVSKIRLSEERLRQERERLSNLIFATHAGTWEWDLSSGRIIINGRWAEILGYTLHDLSPLTYDRFCSMIHPDDLPVMQHQLEKHLSGKMAYYRFEFRMQHKESHWRWIESCGRVTQYAPDGTARQMSGTHADITERKKDELRLNQLSRAVEQNPASVIITNHQGDIEYVNPQFERITGYPSAEVLGQTPRLLKTGSQNIAYYENLWNTITSGQVWRGELHNKKRNGDYFWEMATIAPIRDDQGSITNFIAIKEDITVQKEIKEQLAKTREETEQMNRLMTARECRIIEMKREINALLKQLDRPPKYTKGL
jgi:PAS domain S-box-containing protein